MEGIGQKKETDYIFDKTIKCDVCAGLLAGEQGRRAADALHDDRHGAGLTILNYYNDNNKNTQL